MIAKAKVIEFPRKNQSYINDDVSTLKSQLNKFVNESEKIRNACKCIGEPKLLDDFMIRFLRLYVFLSDENCAEFLKNL